MYKPRMSVYIYKQGFKTKRKQCLLWNLKETNILLMKWETQLREKPLRGSQTQDFYYSRDKASYKAIALTYP
jgi:hypothetical protein